MKKLQAENSSMAEKVRQLESTNKGLENQLGEAQIKLEKREREVPQKDDSQTELQAQLLDSNNQWQAKYDKQKK